MFSKKNKKKPKTWHFIIIFIIYFSATINYILP